MYRFSSIAVVLLSLAACRVALAESQDGEGAPHRRHHRHHHHHSHHHEAVPATQSLVATGAGDVASEAAAEQEAPAAGAAQPDAAPSSQAPPAYQVVKADSAAVVKAPAGTSVCICQRGMPPPPPTCQMTCPTDAQGPICVCQPGMPTPPPPCDAQCPGPKVEVYVAHQGNESKAFAVEAPEEEEDEADKPVPAPKGPYMDVDLDMPYGHLEPFGREDTAQELTEQSMMESDAMVDQLEKAEVAEEKRAVFRALTRLRGAAIASFDGIARSQTGNIDQYAKVNKWREAHPVHHLASEEADVYKWAFPDKSD